MKNKIQSIKNIFFYFIGFFWITAFIYFRFIKKRSFYELETLKNDVNNYIIISNIVYIIIHIIILFYAFYLITKKENKTSFYFIQILKKYIDIWLIKPIESIRDLIAPNIPGSGLFYCKVAEFIEKNIELRTKILVIFFNFFPRIIIAHIFFIELVFYNKIEMFIYSLTLLIIPLLWNIFVNLFTNFGERSLIDIPKYVKVTGIGDDLGNGWHSSYKIEPLPQYHYEPNDLKEWSDTWFIVINIYTFGETFIKGFKNKISPYITIITSSLYLSASIYKLIYIIF